MIDRICEFFENMNEMVYVSDMDTYEIYYMNRKARELYGFQSCEEVKGKTCYKVLRGCSSSCEICTNKNLRSGYFEEWKYYNPVFGRNFSLKDTLLEDKGRRFRVEIAIDISTQEQQKETIREYVDNEAMLNEGLRISLAASDPEESIQMLLEYLGKALKSERVYIFEETQKTLYDNTYEWCAPGVSAEKDHLQNVPYDALKFWIERFRNNQNVIIRDMDQVKETDPISYGYLAPQRIHSLVACPLVSDDKVIGFYGVDNPPSVLLGNISTLLQIMGHFFVSLLKRRNLMKRLEVLSLCDQLTGCGNRHAMEEFISQMHPKESIGVVYGDVMGLKRVNDMQGHQAGDQLLIRASECLEHVFGEYARFRIGGDEFIVLCSGITEKALQERIRELERDMKANSVWLALGSIWYPDSTVDMDQMLSEADARMYEKKREYYEEMSRTEK
jgi:diguanylate cyclase (GGDEF)-like protein